jgi:integrase
MRTPTQPPAPTIKIKGLYKRGTTYWYARQLNGKRDFVSLETSDPFEAVKKIAALNGAEVLSDGSHLEFAVEEYAAFCERTGNWTEASVEAKRPVLRQWAKWAGKIPPAKVTTEHMRAYHDMRLKTANKRTGKAVKPSTAYGNLMTIQSFFNWCTDIKRTCASNPVVPLTARRSKQKIKTPKTGVRKNFCTPELRDLLISRCPNDQLKYILFCGFHAGLRKNEIIESKAEWFDLKAGLLHLSKHAGIDFKDNEERTIPLTEEFRAFMKKFAASEPYMIAPDATKGRPRRLWIESAH